ncbi:MAG: DUF962 domain-containing protein [Candidatus Omnitrophica bacterium]|nr:DUF962 domain-containing protein [Candidatus Omnitrophota bacterium]
MKALIKYIKNYRSRHANNVNMVLHIIGIPEAVFGLFQLLTGRWKIGLLNIFLGYLWQWIGHTYIEKNEIGELIGIKNVMMKLIKK